MNKKANLEGTNPVYKAITVILLILVVLFFLFPLYWIISGSFTRSCLTTRPSCGSSISSSSPRWP